jgi:hypothetical protein
MNDFLVIGGWAASLLTMVAILLWLNRDLRAKPKD